MEGIFTYIFNCGLVKFQLCFVLLCIQSLLVTKTLFFSLYFPPLCVLLNLFEILNKDWLVVRLLTILSEASVLKIKSLILILQLLVYESCRVNISFYEDTMRVHKNTKSGDRKRRFQEHNTLKNIFFPF